VTVNVVVPIGVEALVLIVKTEVFAGLVAVPVTDDGLNAAVAPTGSPLALNATVHDPLPLKLTVTVYVAGLPTVTEPGLWGPAEMLCR
jgi:hypothetical protein